MKETITICFILLYINIAAQPNCDAFKYYGDLVKYEACKAAEKRRGHYQFSRKYQEALDDAIAIDSTFAFAYKAKSTAYLKSGDFITWKKLIDKAVKYNPEEELFYRASCRYQFFNDYAGAIKDIEYLDSLISYDIGHSQNGDYHLNILKALCYKALGKPQKAISIIENQLSDPNHIIGVYDYLHLGVLYLELGQYDKAIANLKKQEIENDIAENRYYIAMVYKHLGKPSEHISNLKIAKKKYKNEIRMFDSYAENIDKIYLVEIENAMK